MLEAVFALWALRSPLPPPPHPVVSRHAAPSPHPPTDFRTTSVRAYALAQVGPGQFACLDPLWQHESGWRADADNKGSTAFGIPQMLGLSHSLTPNQQVDAGLAYIDGRYGSPCGAWAHWQGRRWY